mmetsp:Transcript_8420/g.23468  ORF Transcript_8420/g.23468 Transcript_8420/m.23468 type:complete len:145 (-) Transcript_8420:96-530(-)
MNPCFSFMKCGNKQQQLARQQARSAVAAHEQSIQEGDQLKRQMSRLISADSGTFPDKLKRQISRTISADSGTFADKFKRQISRTISADSGTFPGKLNRQISRTSSEKAAMALGHYGFPDMYQQEEKKQEPYEKRRISGSGLGRL